MARSSRAACRAARCEAGVRGRDGARLRRNPVKLRQPLLNLLELLLRRANIWPRLRLVGWGHALDGFAHGCAVLLAAGDSRLLAGELHSLLGLTHLEHAKGLLLAVLIGLPLLLLKALLALQIPAHHRAGFWGAGLEGPDNQRGDFNEALPVEFSHRQPPSEYTSRVSPSTTHE